MKKKLLLSMYILSAALAVFAALVVIVAAWVSEEKDVLPSLWLALPLGAAVFLLGFACARPLSNAVIRPIDPDDQGISAYEELSPLFRRIESQRNIIKESASELAEKERGLHTIMENMAEGLVLLDGRGLIMSMNRSAAQLLGTAGEDLTGKHIFAANRDPMLQAAVHTALGGTACEEQLHLGGLFAQVMASPVWVDSVVRGVVLLIFDITAKHEAEQLRREFSANVSHELKTPLTSLSGFAEIMKNGLVKPEDVPRFAENIYREAQRLIDLINDIIRISRLDEGLPGIQTEDVELLALSRQVAERLAPKAAEYQVDLRVEGEPATVHGSAQLLDEMLFNLCDNAVKYNRPGGWVRVSVEAGARGPVFTVRDNGIGIPPEHQPRIFERFYRVDKSHSKETGGTGLGLSIVKHGAMFHHAAVELESAPGQGTAITLRFEGQRSEEPYVS